MKNNRKIAKKNIFFKKTEFFFIVISKSTLTDMWIDFFEIFLGQKV